MKNVAIILFAMSLASGFQMYAQPASVTGNFYEDAKLFVNGIQSADAKFLSVVSYYFERTDVTSFNAGTIISSNSFLEPLVSRINIRPAVNPVVAVAPTGFGSGIGGMNVAKFADGAAKFLIERGKLEISMTFFSRFNEELKKYPELKLLLPRSFEIVKKIETHNFQNFLQELQDAFAKDMTNMPVSLLSLRNMEISVCEGDAACQARIASVTAAYTSAEFRPLILSLIAMQGIIDGNNIKDIVNKMVVDQAICGQPNDNFNAYLKITAILMEMFQSADTNGSLFLDQGQLRDLFSSPDLLRVFLGLGLQKFNMKPCYTGLQITGGRNLEDVFNAVLVGQQKYYGVMGTFDRINISSAGVVRQLRNSSKVESDQVITLVSSSLQLVENILRALEKVTDVPLGQAHTTLIRNLSLATEICVDIEQKNYAGIFNGTIKFIEINQIITDTKAKEKFVKYMAFGANLASATTSDEVKEAIDAVALPPGSYSIKQKSSYSISFNGYAGYSWDFNSKGLYMRGIYAPIGFTFSKGLSRKFGGSLSVFTSLIDIGGIAAYRLENDSTDALKQEVRLESLFSPSAQLQVGIPKTPLAITFGWRYTPKLFYSGDTDNFRTVPSKSVFNLSVLIDIPIATLYNRQYEN